MAARRWQRCRRSTIPLSPHGQPEPVDDDVLDAQHRDQQRHVEPVPDDHLQPGRVRERLGRAERLLRHLHQRRREHGRAAPTRARGEAARRATPVRRSLRARSRPVRAGTSAPSSTPGPRSATPSKHAPLFSADVDDRAEGRKVVCLQQRVVQPAGQRRHPAVEDLLILGPRGAVGPGSPHRAGVPSCSNHRERCRAGLSTRSSSPDAPCAATSRASTARSRSARLRRPGRARRSRSSPSRKEARGGECLHQPVERRRDACRPARQPARRSRARDEVGDTEFGGDVDRLRKLEAVNELRKLVAAQARPFASRRSTKTSISPPHGSPTSQASSSLIP